MSLSRKCPKCKKRHIVEMPARKTSVARIKSFQIGEAELLKKIANCECHNK